MGGRQQETSARRPHFANPRERPRYAAPQSAPGAAAGSFPITRSETTTCLACEWAPGLAAAYGAHPFTCCSLRLRHGRRGPEPPAPRGGSHPFQLVSYVYVANAVRIRPVGGLYRAALRLSRGLLL
jgi:hypothetical protein